MSGLSCYSLLLLGQQMTRSCCFTRQTAISWSTCSKLLLQRILPRATAVQEVHQATSMGGVFSGLNPLKGRTIAQQKVQQNPEQQQVYEPQVGKARTHQKASRSVDISTTPYGQPLPPAVHAVVSPEEVGEGRVFLVGDVHGCCDELEQLLRQCGFREGTDLLIMVGDLVNKGPDSTKVLDLAIRLGARAVRGNHDDAALAAYAAWKRGDAYKAKLAWVQQLEPRHVDFLAHLPFSLCLPSHSVLVVHAGFVPGVPLPQQRLFDMYKMRDLIVELPPGAATKRPSTEDSGRAASCASQSPRGSSTGPEYSNTNGMRQHLSRPSWGPSEEPVPDGFPWGSKWEGPDHVFFGHDAKRGLQQYPFATGLDTGCVYGNVLTACILPSQRELAALQQDCPQADAPEDCPAGAEQGPGTEDNPIPGEALRKLGARLATVRAKQAYAVSVD